MLYTLEIRLDRLGKTYNPTSPDDRRAMLRTRYASQSILVERDSVQLWGAPTSETYVVEKVYRREGEIVAALRGDVYSDQDLDALKLWAENSGAVQLKINFSSVRPA